MREDALLVLAASVSAHDRQCLEMTFEKGGFEVRGVAGAEDVESELSSRRGPCVLVIDSGLLAMAHDAQWRVLRSRHPGLGAVVRELIDRDPGVERAEEHTFRVHPDHREGLLQAVRALGATAARG